MNIDNLNNPRYQRMDGPTTEGYGKVNYYMDNQSWCTFMCTERSGNMVLGLEKHESLDEAMTRLNDLHHGQVGPADEEVLEGMVAARIFHGLEIEDEI